MKVLIIIPAYNEGENIRNLIWDLQKYNEFGYDILVINDGSTDDTARACREEGITVIDLPCNLGIGGAVQTGYLYAEKNSYDIAIQVDGDGQHSPEYISELIEPLRKEEVDLVIGSRYINGIGFQSTRIRRIGIKFFTLLIWFLTRQCFTDPTSGFRACNKKVIQLFARNYPKDYPEPESLVFLKRYSCKIIEKPVVMKSRCNGESSINIIQSIYYMIKVTLAILIDISRNKRG
ncbi:glycosyltransferase family 2 protein [Pelosinus sp. IPA-1]|uniref:glycosyltransferase family 2 protein n=1 Tax=Pelosinus sp. IPA-1 TaxID=3029569 RepID=UPI002436207F|nr:glycosyltransferase family 2 protein [Pelosinus sp. IPA-1]GMB01249.1 glycosyl transferase family 2 [Pelosinus sp. IPA-1]